MKKSFPGGVWPTMITPFTKDNKVDYDTLSKLVEWYITHGVSGLFAVCQSSEMFYLTLNERVAIARFVKEISNGHVPVIASGHISDRFEDQVVELNKIAETGVDGLILISNRMAGEEESDDVWMQNTQELLNHLPKDTPLGLYECPYPYKRVLTPKVTEWCAKNGRFFFLKDTCCDIEKISEKLRLMRGTNLKLYNAHTTTLVDSLRMGAAGYSGVMANFQPDLYAYICRNFNTKEADDLIGELFICSMIECQLYPVNAKYNLQLEGLPIETVCRSKSDADFTSVFKKEIGMLRRITEQLNSKYIERNGKAEI